MSVVHFVRGMAWHDVGKPFALGTPKHAALGYWLLRLAAYDGEALVALAHGHILDTLGRYFGSGGAPVPGILALCNPLDCLAASVYSLQSRGLTNIHFHSLQNPFSRLPDSIPGWEGAFVVSVDELSKKVEPKLWKHLCSELPAEWQNALTAQAKKGIEAPDWPLPAPVPLPTGKDVVNTLLRYMAHYPERTYPPVNDTSLTSHTRLSGILAYVVHENLAQRNSAFLAQTIEKRDGELWLGNTRLLDFIERKTDTGERLGYSQAQEVVRDSLKASLVRVAFEGHRALFESAVRVDDLHGARELVGLTKEAFKQALADELTAPDLAEFLTISESQFDLIYLLPGAKEPLEVVVHQAHEAALGEVSRQVMDRWLKRDFPQIAAGQRSELWRQLADIGYGLRIIPVEAPQEDSFNEFAAAYGRNLLKAYVDSQDYAAFPAANLPNEVNRRDNSAPLAAAETCQVCGNYPILTPPDDLSDEEMDEWQRSHDYAGHIFRGERERICLSCVARRTLAYGKIAKQMDDVVRPMLQQDKSQPKLWRSVRPEGGPDLPPLLPLTTLLRGDDELINVDAFYVRYRRTDGGVDRSALDIFPTTGYAADATGNLVLLSLQPTKTLFGCYDYDEAIREVGRQGEKSSQNIEPWQKAFVQAVKGDTLVESIRQAQPHLARVMERIRRVQNFYNDLYHRLAEVPPRLRVLPLDADYPTLRLLVPADELDEVLLRLEKAVTETLFSAQVGKDDHATLHKLLSLVAPDLLHGTVILFKHKCPLYLALEAERNLFRLLQTSDPAGRLPGRPGNSQWYGLRLAFSDLRGTLSQAGPLLAEVTYADLGPVIDLEKSVDRRTVLLWAEAAEYLSPKLADALAIVRARKLNQVQKVEQLLTKGEDEKESRKFKPVLYMKMATRG